MIFNVVSTFVLVLLVVLGIRTTQKTVNERIPEENEFYGPASEMSFHLKVFAISLVIVSAMMLLLVLYPPNDRALFWISFFSHIAFYMNVGLPSLARSVQLYMHLLKR